MYVVPFVFTKILADLIAPVLSSLLNEEVATVLHSNLFKIARVLTIYKCGSKVELRIYKPISVKRSREKSLEGVFHARIGNKLQQVLNNL